MPDKPIPFPPPPLGPGQVEVKLGTKRYVMNVPEPEVRQVPQTKTEQRSKRIKARPGM